MHPFDGYHRQKRGRAHAGSCCKREDSRISDISWGEFDSHFAVGMDYGCEGLGICVNRLGDGHYDGNVRLGARLVCS